MICRAGALEPADPTCVSLFDDLVLAATAFVPQARERWPFAAAKNGEPVACSVCPLPSVFRGERVIARSSWRWRCPTSVCPETPACLPDVRIVATSGTLVTEL
ncbi:MAG: hypothetical protein R3C97_13585 [Geminicoccaceae bacterium]